MTTTQTQTRQRQRASEYVSLSDEDLLRLYRQTGDRNAFAVLVHRYEGELYGYLRRYLGDSSLAEDTFQATFLQVHLKCGQFEEGRKVRPWLYTIATNQAIDIQRRSKRHKALSMDRLIKQFDEGSGPLDLPAAEPDRDALTSLEDQERIRAAVDSLPESLRTTLSLVYYQGMKYREAAEVLSIPVGTVKSRIHTAISKLDELFHRP